LARTGIAKRARPEGSAGGFRRACDPAGRTARQPVPRWLAAAAAVVLMAGAGLGYRQYRGEVAKERVMQAFRIASVKVNRIQTQVREAAR